MDSDIMPILIKLIREGSYKAQKEACMVLSNLTSRFTYLSEIMMRFVDFGVIPSLCSFLSCQDTEMILILLTALENIFRTGEVLKDSCGCNLFVRLFLASDDAYTFYELFSSESTYIFDRIEAIMSTYFQDDALYES